MTAKPTVEELGIDVAAQVWRRSGEGDGAIEIAFTGSAAPQQDPHQARGPHDPQGPPDQPDQVHRANRLPKTDSDSADNASNSTHANQPKGAENIDETVATDGSGWVLMRVAGDPEHRVLVFDRHEWECFLDGARNGEFDDAASLTS